VQNYLGGEDVKLMLAFCEGNEHAFEKILNKYEIPVINFAYRFIGNRIDAEDIAQEVFLKIYNSKKKYKPNAKFTTFLYRITSNICVDYKRKKKTQPQIYSIDNTFPSSEVTLGSTLKDDVLSPDEQIEEKEVQKKIHDAIMSLPNRQRLALNLKIYEGNNYQEISQILNCSVLAVETLLFRARQNLTSILR
jgi:RNA polymerase sigma-70 factor (ECF subfamily)